MKRTRPRVVSVPRPSILASCVAIALYTALSAPAGATPGAASPGRITQIIPVINCSDSEASGSLRYALTQANTGDTVDLTGLTCPMITLRDDLGELEAFADQLTVIGPGRDALAVRGSGSSRVLRYWGEHLLIDGLTLRDGRASDGIGGCVRTSGKVTLRHARVTGCVAGGSTNDRARGGAIYTYSAVELIHSIVSDNSATNRTGADVPGTGVAGGGIYAFADLELKDGSEVSNNTARAHSGSVGGGGIWTHKATIVESRITGNLAETRDDTVSPYFGTRPSASGGGIFATGPTAVVDRSTISDNTAHAYHGDAFGGGMRSGLGAYSMGNTTKLQRSTLSGNRAVSGCDACDIQGGGILAMGALEVQSSTVAGNLVQGDPGSAALASGGGILVAPVTSNDLTLVNTTVSGNQVLGGAGQTGGGITLRTASAQIFNSTIAFNRSPQAGGGLFIDGGMGTGKTWSLASSIVAKNQAAQGRDIEATATANLSYGTHNLIAAVSSAVVLPFDTLSADPLLYPLDNNGGPTRTHEPRFDSPAVDAGINLLSLIRDQRGPPWVRSWGAAPDIGAFELQPDLDRIFKNGFEVPPDPDLIFRNGFDG